MTDIGPLVLGPIAHGGHCVAHIDGRVVFVRHGIPGEIVRVRITDDSKPRFWWGEVAEVIEASSDRLASPCPVAGVCGGCAFQHIALDRQRDLKAQVVAEQLHRLAGIDRNVQVEAAPGESDGLGWRTRMRYLTDEGRFGLRAWRSDQMVDLSDVGCAIAHPNGRWAAAHHAQRNREIQVIVADSGISVIDGSGYCLSGAPEVTQTVSGRRYRVRADGFWQVHPSAAQALTDAVVDMLEPSPGELALDLYCGVGLFAGRLVDEGCQVIGVEIGRAAIAMARYNVPQARFRVGPTERLLSALPRHVDLIVLDPPRSGAGAKVVRYLSHVGARAIAYVACDPAALARDLATFADHGYRLADLRALDLFPMTHHVECVALLVNQQI